MSSPAALHPTVGREAELIRLGTLLGEARTVWVAGPPGVGKSHLVRDLAASGAGRLLLDVRAERSPAGLAARIADAVRAGPLPDGEDATDRLAAALAGRGPLTLVLDQAEGLAGCAALLARLLELAPELRLVLASRNRIAIPAHATLELEPLALPAAGETDPERILSSPAVRLFVAHARSRRDGFRPEADAAALAAVVRALDGLPLAILLGASRMDVLSTGQLGQLLAADRFRVLSAADGALPALRAAIASSWEDLGPDERDLLARASVFEGGFTLPAAVDVVLPPDAAADGLRVLDLLSALRRRSLLGTSETTGGGEMRFTMHAAIRAFAAERAAELGVLGDAARRHARHYGARALREARAIYGRGGRLALAWLKAEEANLAAVIERFEPGADRADDALADALRCFIGVAACGWTRAEQAPSRELLLRLEERSGGLGAIPWELLAEVTLTRARLFVRHRADETHAALVALRDEALGRGDAAVAGRASRLIVETATQLARLPEAVQAGRLAVVMLDRAPQARDDAAMARIQLGRALKATLRLDQARMCYEEALERGRDQGNVWLHALAAQELAGLAMELGDHPAARAAFDEAITLHDSVENRLFAEFCRGSLGVVAHDQGDLRSATRAYDAAIRSMRSLGDVPLTAQFLGFRGLVCLEEGDLERAERLLEEAVHLARSARFRTSEATFAGCLGVARAERGRIEAGREEVRRARALAAGSDEPIRAALAVLAAHVEVVAAREALRRRAVNEARALLAALPPLLDGVPIERSLECRLFARLLAAAVRAEPALAGLSESEPLGAQLAGGDAAQPVLRYSLQERWFAVDGGPPVPLRRHPMLWATLSTLIDRHEARPGEPVGIPELLALVWPDERLRLRTSRSRVYVAVSKLRKLGLDPFIEKDDAGYHLRPDIRIRPDGA
jgi:tetratricopeptide (TPR) repeat protein